MKKILKHLPLLLLFATLHSCKKEETRAYLNSSADGSFTLKTNVANALTLLQTNQADTVAIANWGDANFGFNAGVNYTLQISKKTANFTTTSIAEMSLLATHNYTFTTKKLNSSLISISAADVATNYVMRIKATVNDSVAPIYSTVIDFTATPYKDVIVYEYPQALRIAGNYQGWNPSAAPKIVDAKASSNGGAKYEGYINFADANPLFKMVKGGDWSAGDFGDANGSGTSGTLKPNTAGNNNVNLSNGAGVYLLKANTVDLNWSAIKIDMWGIIGDATPNGWGNPTAMTYDAATNSYSITTNLTVGKIKFRANSNWDINFGDDNTDGIPEYGGANIDVAVAGNYVITLDLTAGNYSYTIKKI
jgi:starch-binding outer membrane protein SusE/F